MRKFVGALFGGYRKQDVDEYVSFLEEELENLKAEANGKFEQQNAVLNDLRQQVADADKAKQTLSDELKNAANSSNNDELLEAKTKELESKNSELKNKDEELKSKVSEILDKDNQLQELRAKLNDAERKLSESRNAGIDKEDSDIIGVIAETKKNIKDLEEKARIKAAVIEQQANDKADEIRARGKVDALSYKKEAQEEIAKGVEQVKLAKYDLYEYLVSIKKAQDSLIATYKELGTILNKFPAKMEQLAMDASFELKTDKEFKWSDLDDDSSRGSYGNNNSNISQGTGYSRSEGFGSNNNGSSYGSRGSYGTKES